jgi:hypothetical protein
VNRSLPLVEMTQCLKLPQSKAVGLAHFVAPGFNPANIVKINISAVGTTHINIGRAYDTLKLQLVFYNGLKSVATILAEATPLED